MKIFHNICWDWLKKLLSLIHVIANLISLTLCFDLFAYFFFSASLLTSFFLVSQDMSENIGQQLLVKARFTFQQTNEDELTFAKGDIISVTRQEDGGWWEGTLNGKTGWFPSNYVREVKGSGGYTLGHITCYISFNNCGTTSVFKSVLLSYLNDHKGA